MLSQAESDKRKKERRSLQIHGRNPEDIAREYIYRVVVKDNDSLAQNTEIQSAEVIFSLNEFSSKKKKKKILYLSPVPLSFIFIPRSFVVTCSDWSYNIVIGFVAHFSNIFFSFCYARHNIDICPLVHCIGSSS